MLSMVLLLPIMSSLAYADDSYTIRQYIQDYYHNTYSEDSVIFDKISITSTKIPNGIWQLSNDFLQNEIFDNQIEKVNESYAIQTQERYFITFQSAENNILYLCITENGEMFFGRYADYDKPNYCEYLVVNPTAVREKLSQICQIGKNGYINQNAVEEVPECSEWAQGIVTKGAELSFIPSYLLKTHFSEKASRIDFCRMAYRMLNEKEQIDIIERIHPFVDVDKEERELAYLYENGIVKGKSETKFCPDDSITREEAATILDRLFKFIYKTDMSDFNREKLYADDSTISDWAKSSVYLMKTYKIMIGIDNDLFSPQTPFSLEQTVATLVRIYEYK